MAEIPDTVDVVQEFVSEVVEGEEKQERHPGWHGHVAVTTLILALLTAIGAMLTGLSANRSLIERTQEIIEVNALEGDRVKIEILKTKHEILAAVGETPDQNEIETIAKFESEVQALEKQAAAEEMVVVRETEVHLIFMVGVTILSLGTALCGLTIILNRKSLWYWSLAFGVLGVVCLAAGLVRTCI